MRPKALLIALFVCGLAAVSRAWDERGHVIVTRIAVGSLPPGMPAWVRQKDSIERLCYLANEPDRWRGLHAAVLNHWNSPDHYLDVDLLPQFGLSLKTLPPFRYEFVARLAAERALHPDRFPPDDPAADADRVQLTPGMLPYRIMELYEQTRSGWSTLRTYEADPEHATPVMISSARERILQSMGLLSHYVGDAAQPLHTTEHHHGWVGANPNQYTTQKSIHSLIDGGVLAQHAITSASIWSGRRPAIDIPPGGVWAAVLDHIDRSFRQVEPLYRLEKTGELRAPAGKAFIEERLEDAAAMLAGLYAAAYRDSQLDDYLANAMQRSEKRDTPPPDAPASAPATSPASQPIRPPTP